MEHVSSAASEYIASLTIMDNEFMARFFDGQNECVRHLVETVLGRDDLEVSSCRTLFALPSLTGRYAPIPGGCVVHCSPRGHAISREVRGRLLP